MGFMKLSSFALPSVLLCSLAVVASAAPVDDFRAASVIAWGAGTGLNASYATLDANVEVRVFFGIFPITQTQTANFVEAPIPKTPGSVNFSINTAQISPTLPSLVVVLNGTQTGNEVRWTQSQLFSQAGGFPVSFTIDINGTPTQVNLVLNNIQVTSVLRSTFTSVTPFYNSVIAANSQARGTHIGGDTDNKMDISTSSITGTIGGVTPSRIEVRVRRLQHISHVGFPISVTGQVSLEDVTSPAGESISWTLRTPAGVLVEQGTTTLDASGNYSLNTNAVVNQNYALYLKGRTHLAKRVNLTLIPAVTGANATLLNGDANNDNEVGPTDFSVLAATFGLFAGDSGFDSRADFNRDGEAGPADFAILARNFGEFGDAP